jgi:hypothetical protein
MMRITNQKKRLTKTDYLAGLQCPKNLWLRINEPGAKEIEVEEGVDELARTYVPGGILIAP